VTVNVCVKIFHEPLSLIIYSHTINKLAVHFPAIFSRTIYTFATTNRVISRCFVANKL